MRDRCRSSSATGIRTAGVTPAASVSCDWFDAIRNCPAAGRRASGRERQGTSVLENAPGNHEPGRLARVYCQIFVLPCLRELRPNGWGILGVKRGSAMETLPRGPFPRIRQRPLRPCLPCLTEGVIPAQKSGGRAREKWNTARASDSG